MTQTATSRDSAVIAEARQRRRKALILGEDGSWLEAYSSRPYQNWTTAEQYQWFPLGFTHIPNVY